MLGEPHTQPSLKYWTKVGWGFLTRLGSATPQLVLRILLSLTACICRGHIRRAEIMVAADMKCLRSFQVCP